MWLPLQLVLEFVGRAAVWLAVMAGLGIAVAVLAALATRRPLRTAWPRLVLGGVLGAMAGASLAARFGLPEPLEFRVWCRPVPLAWSAGGAVVGVALAWAWDRFRPSRPAGSTAPDPAPATPAPEPADGDREA